MLAEVMVAQLQPENLEFLEPEDKRKVRDIRRALCIMLTIDSPEQHVWDAFEAAKRIAFK